MTTPTTAEPQYTVSQGAEVAKEFTGTSNGATIRMGFEILKLRATIARLEGEQIAEQRTHEEKFQRMAADLAAAKREAALLTEIARCETEFAMAARTRADAAERRVEAMAKGLKAVEALISESRGVIGLHLNGDDAPWEDLRTGGSFEEWLREFDTALAAASGAADGAATTEGGR